MNISARDRALLVAVAAIAAIAAFYVLVLTPQRHQANQLEGSITAAHKDLTTAQSQYASGRSAETQLSLTTSDFAAAQRAVPSQSNIPRLLQLLQREADEAHVSITSITLSGSSSSSTAATATPAPTATGSTAPAAATAQPIPVSLEFGGGYQALNRMVHKLDGLVRISHGHLRAGGPLIGIGNVTLAPGTSSGGGSSLSVTLTANIYQYADASTVTGSGGTS